MMWSVVRLNLFRHEISNCVGWLKLNTGSNHLYFHYRNFIGKKIVKTMFFEDICTLKMCGNNDETIQSKDL